MPGNEVGDRVHNFFGQENLSQGQRHPQATDGNWPGLSNNLWVGNQRQVGSPVNSSLKSYNIQPVADSERGHGSPSLHVPHGLNFMQSNLRPEFGRVQYQSQQPTANGYMHGHQMFQTRQNEANFLGVDTESDKQNLTSRGLSTPESRGSGPEHAKNNSARLETSESPVGFDFFGGQQQMSGQHLSMMQSSPRQQQPRISDMQLQRQAMFTQMQEFQRQQQLQQLERQQLVLANQASSIAKQAAGNHSPTLMNGVTINEASNNQWPPNVVAGNTNWLQRGASPVMQGGSSGHVLSHEQAQALRLMGFVPQQADQSLYGVPISSSSGTPGSYPHFQMDKPAMQQISVSRNSFPGNQYAAFSGPVSMQEGSLASRQDFQGKSMVGPTAAQSLSSGFNLETLHRVNPQQRNEPMEEFQGRQELVGLLEPSPEKAVGQVAPSQGVATLDPTEEKILFGSDDNLWDAFGRSANVGMGGSSMLDGADIFGGLSSVQSGTWSALMQSAVAETSSVDGGIQEEWCGPSFRNPEPPVGTQQPSSVGVTNKQQSGWAGNNLHSSSDLNSRPSPHFADANRPSTSGSFSSIQGFQQSGSKTLHERGDVFQTDSSHRFISQSPEQGSKWLDHNPPPQPPADGSHNNYGTISHSSGREINANSISGSWNRQERSSSHNNDNQPNNMSNGWNFTESVSTDGGSNLKNHGNPILSRSAEGGDLKRGMHEEISRAAGMWKTDSAPNSNVEVAHPKYASPQISREGSSINNAAKSNSSAGRAYQEGQQHLANSHDFWTPVDSLVNSKGGEALGKNQHHLDKNHLILESSGNNCLDKGVVEMHDMENNNTKENTSDTFYHNAYHHASTGGMKENVVSDAGDSRTLPGSKQHSSGNAGRKPSGTRKFQYHPMGDVGVKVEPSSGRKPVTHSQAMTQQASRGFKSHDQGSFGQSKFMGHTDRSSMEIEKVNIRGSDEPPSKSMLPGYAPSTSTPFDRSTGNNNNTSKKAAPPSSQHMLELLHKVDQPREHGNATHFSPSDHNTSSEMPEVETSDGSVGHIQRNQSSVSQGFGLQLAPPSQRIPHADQSSSQAVLGSGRVHSEMGEKGHTWLASTASVQSLPSSHEASQGELRNSLSGSSGQTGNKSLAPQYHIQGGLSASSEYGFPHSRSQRENQHMTAASGQVTASQSVNIPFDRLAFRPQQLGESFERAQTSQSPLTDKSESASQDNLTSAEASLLNIADQSRSRVAAAKIPDDAEPSVTSGMSHQGAVPKVLTNVWTSVPLQQPLVSAEPSKASSQLFKSQLQTKNHLVTTFHGSPKLNEQGTRERGNGFSAFGVYSNLQSSGPKEQPSKQNTGQQVSPENIQTAQKTNVSKGKESTANNYIEASASNSAATQRDIEAFGRSLKPNISSHQSYSLLNQVQAMKSTEIDGSDPSVKRLRGPDSGAETQQVSPQGGPQLSYGYNTMLRDSSADHTPVPSGDSKMLSFASKVGDTRLSNASGQDMYAFSRKNSQNFSSGSNASSLRGEQSQVSPQMAPSWFDQYGTFKNGQILPMHDTLRATLKSMEQPSIAGKPGDLHAREQMEEPIDTSDASTIPQSLALKPISSEQLTSPHLLRPDATDESLTVERPKKRKSATSELSPWHKELTKVSQRLLNMRAADVEWAQATNRLAEKVEDESEMIEDRPPMFRSRKRLILTTQLVQQLLRPPPSAVLSADASSSFESVAYFASRLSLGDACSAISCSRNDIQTPSPPDRANHLPEKLKTPERVHRYFPKVVEDFVEKARKLENDLLRLDKRTSILDLRVDSQDLEKFSVINRFAKFHGRAQGDGTEASSSSDAPANAQRTCPQKYVTALPVPRNLPDRVQCLSL
ncbi:hypothetical protein ABKV19_011498 [Rosa sericea]